MSIFGRRDPFPKEMCEWQKRAQEAMTEMYARYDGRDDEVAFRLRDLKRHADDLIEMCERTDR